MNFVGIDPGLGGAVAMVRVDPRDGHTECQWFDTPTVTFNNGKKMVRRYDKQAMNQILSQFRQVQAGILEFQQAMPEQGASSGFNLGHGYGLWEGMLVALKLPYEIIHPRVWKKIMVGVAKDKEASRMRAQQIFPKAELHLKKHEGRAEALLMAEFGRRKWMGEHSHELIRKN